MHFAVRKKTALFDLPRSCDYNTNKSMRTGGRRDS